MIIKELISDQAQTKGGIITQLMKDLEAKNEIILANAGTILRQSKQIDDLAKTLDFTTRQYEVLQKKYAEVLRLSKKAEQDYESCLKNLEEEVGRLRNAR